MIEHIKLKFGSSPEAIALEFDTTPVTIFVGPNNSGKSKTLMELEQYCHNGGAGTYIILDDILFSPISNPQKELERFTLPDQNSNPPNYIRYGNWKKNTQIAKTHLLDVLTKNNQKKNEYANYYVSLNTIRLDGSNRIQLIQPQQGGDLQAAPQNVLSTLLKDDIKRFEVRRILKDAFNKYFVIDPTLLGTLRIRLSDTAPVNIIEEIGIHKESIAFHNKALDISLASDGVKAFTGIITTIIAGDPEIILIDEPEAFLHPALATNLGKEISNSVKGSSKRLFVSTHSANFLMGCIQSGALINIVRLTYSGGVATARLLQKDKVLKLMRNPLLRSTGVLNGLFYEYVIVTEADSDRAFYQEINERLLAQGVGIPNCLFINAQNKQTIHEIMRPLREMGIPCAAIVDIDIIKEGGIVWANFLSSGGMPQTSIAAAATARSHIKNAFDATGVNYKINGGIALLTSADKASTNDLFDQLEDYGLFAVRSGELESWLKTLGATGHSPKWLIEMFEKLGEDPNSSTYVKPSTGDIWDFMQKIKKWLLDTARKGTPA